MFVVVIFLVYKVQIFITQQRKTCILEVGSLFFCFHLEKYCACKQTWKSDSIFLVYAAVQILKANSIFCGLTDELLFFLLSPACISQNYQRKQHA